MPGKGVGSSSAFGFIGNQQPHPFFLPGLMSTGPMIHRTALRMPSQPLEPSLRNTEAESSDPDIWLLRLLGWLHNTIADQARLGR